MKKILCLVLVIMMMIMLISACSDNSGDEIIADSQNEDEIAPTGSEPTESESNEVDMAESELGDIPEETEEEPDEIIGFTLEFAGFTIYMDQNMADVSSAIGEPIRVFIQESCAFPGQDDHIYVYPGIQIMTYPSGDDQFVHTILILDDSISINGNIYLGSSFDDVIKAYGTNYEQDFNMFTFTEGQTSLAFLIDDNDEVEQIVFGLILD
jgi:hypothetical protein